MRAAHTGCRDIFQETKVHVCHLNGINLMMNFGEKRGGGMPSLEELDIMGCGAYKMMRQMEFLKVDPDAPDPEPANWNQGTPVEALAEVLRPYGSPVSIVFGSPKEHGGGRAFRSEAERLARCEHGERIIRDMVDRMGLEALKQAIEIIMYT